MSSSHAWSRMVYSQTQKFRDEIKGKTHLYKTQIPKHCINHPFGDCTPLCQQQTLLDFLPKELQSPSLSFKDKKTGQELVDTLPKLCILSGELEISIETLHFAKTLGVILYPKDKWTICFLDIKNKLFSQNGNPICSDDSLFTLLKQIIIGNERRPNFDLKFYQLKQSAYNKLRSQQNREKWLPKIRMISATPSGITPCNILKALSEFAGSLNTSPTQAAISTTDVLQALPGIDVTGKTQKEVVETLPTSVKAEIITNAQSALKKYPELQDSTGLTPEDLVDHRYPSVKLCKSCGVCVSDLRAYISSIAPESLSIRHFSVKPMSKASRKWMNKIEKVHSDLYVTCFCCQRYFSWDSLKTKFHQTFYDKDFIQTIEKKLVIQALLNLFPDNFVQCTDSMCRGKEGFLFNTLNRFCGHCESHHDELCEPGINMIFCVSCNKQHHMNLHKALCPYCVRPSCTICKAGGSEYHTDRPCPGSVLQTIDSATAQLLLSDGTKICPGCKNGVTKTMACDHMTCPCGVHFCYRCNRNITTTGYAAHNCPSAGAGQVDRVFANNWDGDDDDDDEFQHYNPAAFA